MLNARSFFTKGIVWVLLIALLCTNFLSVQVNAESTETVEPTDTIETTETIETETVETTETVGTAETIETAEAVITTEITEDLTTESKTITSEVDSPVDEAMSIEDESSSVEIEPTEENSPVAETTISNQPSARSANSDFEFIEENGTITITGYIGTSTNVVIPEIINEKTVTKIGNEAFFYKSIASIEIPDSVTKIGSDAFAYNQLTNIDLPANLTTIGDGAFGHNQIASVIIPNSITVIEPYAFYWNEITYAEIPDSVTTIGEGAFKNNLLPNVDIPSSVTTIGDSAFQSNKLISVVIPNSVTAIGDSVFYFNRLTYVEIPNTVTTIGMGAFTYNNLTSVEIPDSVTTIGSIAFANNKLTYIDIPDSVKIIDYGVFSYNKLTGVKISNTATTIGEIAFIHNELTNVVIPGSVTSIAEDSFKHNPIVEKTIPDSITRIVRKSFLQMADILNPTKADIDFYCFPQEFEIKDFNETITGYNGTSKNVTIPASIYGITVKAIGKSAFSGKQLTGVTIPNSVTKIEADAFKGNNLTRVTIPNSVVNIGVSAFSGNPVSHASIPASITYIQGANGETIKENPGISDVLEHCFDSGTTIKFEFYIKAGSNIRRTSDGQIIETLKMPIYVTGTVDGNYFKFTHQGQAAYVILNLTTTSPQVITGYAKSTANVRSSPNGSVTGTILRGHKVSGTLVGNWVRFTYSGKTCYVYSSMLQADPIKVTRYIYANSIIRSAPNGSMITKLWRPLLINGTLEGAWTKFTYDGNPAYVATSLTTTTNPPITGYAKSAINVRNAPGGSVIGTIPIGRQIKGVLVGNMVRFTYNNRTGYISASLLQETPVQVTRYIIANSIIRSAPNGSIIIRTWRPLLVSGTIEGAWLKFTYNSKTAYVAMSLTTTGNPAMTGYAKQTLYVRYTPNGSVVGTIPAGYKVSGVLVGNMVRFTYNGRTSYVYASLLRK